MDQKTRKLMTPHKALPPRDIKILIDLQFFMTINDSCFLFVMVGNNFELAN